MKEEIPPGIVCFKNKRTGAIFDADDSIMYYDEWAAYRMELKENFIHTISVEGKEWSVGDKTSEGVITSLHFEKAEECFLKDGSWFADFDDNYACAIGLLAPTQPDPQPGKTAEEIAYKNGIAPCFEAVHACVIAAMKEYAQIKMQEYAKHAEATLLIWKEMCADKQERLEKTTKEWLNMNDEIRILKASKPAPDTQVGEGKLSWMEELINARNSLYNELPVGDIKNDFGGVWSLLDTIKWHINALDNLMQRQSQTSPPAPDSEAIEVLRKLVWLKDIKDRWAGVIPVPIYEETMKFELEQYKIAKPIAWEKARKMLQNIDNQ